MDLNLTGAIAANVSLMQADAKIDYSTIISALAVLLGVIISQFFEWLKRRDEDRKDARKRFFELKKESYYNMIDAIEDYIYADKHKKDDVETKFARLEKAAYKVELVGSEKVASLIRERWDELSDNAFIEKELIPALKEDIQSMK